MCYNFLKLTGTTSSVSQFKWQTIIFHQPRTERKNNLLFQENVAIGKVKTVTQIDQLSSPNFIDLSPLRHWQLIDFVDTLRIL